MTEVARTRGGSAEVERGGIAEVAALGNELTGLFNRLGITQSQYAYRVHLDKSAVSRYLSGRRLAPQEFVDRLVREVEEHVGAPLRLEVKEAIRGRRLEALRACDPAAYELETLRGELARSRRDAERMNRNIEALHVLLEHKESEVRAVADDLTRLRLDWGAERVALARSQEELRSEITRLREDLADAERLRLDAELRGEELRGTVLRLEEELARRPAAGPGALPLATLKDRLAALWEESNTPEVARELTEVAWSRSLEEVAELLLWLREGGHAAAVDAFVVDVARLRPLDDVLAFAPRAVEARTSLHDDVWTPAVATRVTLLNVEAVYRGLGESEGERVLAEAVRRTRNDADAIGLVLAALPDVTSFDGLPRLQNVLSMKRDGDWYGLGVSVELMGAGRAGMALALLSTAAGFRPRGSLAPDLARLDEAQTDVLFDLVPLLPGVRLTDFASHVVRSGSQRLLDRLLALLEDHDHLVLPGLSSDPELIGVVPAGRRSRSQ
ncbi:helix-turn-helix domain-containing protein [Streptomyces sp. NPDC058861]|uniref:helix-turn-helix domain-containing protein n=1 Tax=Streptomyces sp. NPDC058861 TaxID=3346653 RepID=UPI00367B53D3